MTRVYRDRGPRPGGGERPELTARQVEVLQLIGAGLRYVDIAQRLGLQPEAVRHHAEACYSKIGVSSRTEALAWWLDAVERVNGRAEH